MVRSRSNHKEDILKNVAQSMHRVIGTLTQGAVEKAEMVNNKRKEVFAASKEKVKEFWSKVKIVPENEFSFRSSKRGPLKGALISATIFSLLTAAPINALADTINPDDMHQDT